MISPISQQAGQAVVLGRLSLSMCLWTKQRMVNPYSLISSCFCQERVTQLTNNKQLSSSSRWLQSAHWFDRPGQSLGFLNFRRFTTFKTMASEEPVTGKCRLLSLHHQPGRTNNYAITQQHVILRGLAAFMFMSKKNVSFMSIALWMWRYIVEGEVTKEG